MNSYHPNAFPLRYYFALRTPLDSANVFDTAFHSQKNRAACITYERE